MSILDRASLAPIGGLTVDRAALRVHIGGMKGESTKRASKAGGGRKLPVILERDEVLADVGEPQPLYRDDLQRIFKSFIDDVDVYFVDPVTIPAPPGRKFTLYDGAAAHAVGTINMYGRGIGDENCRVRLKGLLRDYLTARLLNGETIDPNAVIERLLDVVRPPTRADAFDESKAPGYTGAAPPFQPAEISQPGMADDLDQQLMSAGGTLRSAVTASYEILARHVDLLNPQLGEGEKVTRAERLLKSYKRQRKANPDFYDDSPQLVAARSIVNRANYQRRKSKLAM
jgi:hypothetical protein